MLDLNHVFTEVSQQAALRMKLNLYNKEDEKMFDPKDVYGDAPNPTKL